MVSPWVAMAGQIHIDRMPDVFTKAKRNAVMARLPDASRTGSVKP
jgi:hypothetical protein